MESGKKKVVIELVNKDSDPCCGQWRACYDDFVNCEESPYGTGDTRDLALMSLEYEYEGYLPPYVKRGQDAVLVDAKAYPDGSVVIQLPDPRVHLQRVNKEFEEALSACYKLQQELNALKACTTPRDGKK